MTLEYLEIMEEIKKAEEQPSTAPRRKCIRSFKSNTRVFDDDSIEVTPQERGQPAQTNVKKIGRSKRYDTTGKNPLTCIELKCPDNVPDKAAYFQKELAKLTKDITIATPELPNSEFLLNQDNLKVCFEEKERKLTAWMAFNTQNMLEARRDLFNLTSEIYKCLVINNNLLTRERD
jgi:hypothetical protein